MSKDTKNPTPEQQMLAIISTNDDASASVKCMEVARGMVKESDNLIADLHKEQLWRGDKIMILNDQNEQMRKALKKVVLEIGVLKHNWDYRTKEFMPDVIEILYPES